MTPNPISRRAFLQRSAAVSVVGAAAPLVLNLAAMADAAAQTSAASEGYKALVCVFLQGGNDHANTLVPSEGAAHAAYARARGGLALPLHDLAGTALPGSWDGQTLALAPALAPLMPLYLQGRMACLANIGPLVQPTTLAEFRARSVPLPPRLFSHNDQQSVWQSHAPEGSLAGWGGRMGDLALAAQGRSALTCVSTAGDAVFLSGNTVVPYQVSPAGVPGVYALEGGLFQSAACMQAFQTLVAQAPQVHALAADHVRVMARALDTNAQLRQVLAQGVSFPQPFDLSNPLARQLEMVARLIAARDSLGLRRQVFFVSLGGFDLHDNLTQRHPLLLGQVAQALVSFQQALDALGVDRQVSTFTASDFGRTLSSNGDGSDHGWGGHHWVLGGAVQGGRVLGRVPEPGLGGPQDAGQGRLLPGLSVQQLAVTLARWFGVTESDLDLVAPGHAAFDAGALSDLMRA